MTTEQKEAIEYLENLRDEYRKSAKERKEKGEPIGYGTLEDLDKLNALEIDLVLDLIQEQEAELKKKEKIIDELAKAFKQDDVRSVEEIKEYFEELAKEEGE